MELAVFEIWGDSDGQLCYPVDDEGFDWLEQRVNGRPQVEPWNPPEMKMVFEDEGQKFIEVDAPSIGPGILAIRERTLPILHPILEGAGELLELKGEVQGVYIFNPWLVDCLNRDETLFDYYSDGKRIMDIEEYVFRPSELVGVDVFKLPDRVVSRNYVTNRFVDAWRNARLSGLRFKKVWCAETPRFEPFFPKW